MELGVVRRASFHLRQAVRLAEGVAVNCQVAGTLVCNRGGIRFLISTLRALNVCLTGLPKGETLGERVVDQRKQQRLSQQRLGARAGISQPTICALERESAGRVSTLVRILNSLKAQVMLRDAGTNYFEQGATDNWNTSPEFLQRIHAVIPEFDLDPCSVPASYVQARTHYYEEDDGLSKLWFGKVWLNPLLAPICPLPLVEAIGSDEAALAPEWAARRLSCCHGLCTSIDGFIADLAV